jgi:hypothetical protein
MGKKVVVKILRAGVYAMFKLARKIEEVAANTHVARGPTVAPAVDAMVSLATVKIDAAWDLGRMVAEAAQDALPV